LAAENCRENRITFIWHKQEISGLVPLTRSRQERRNWFWRYLLEHVLWVGAAMVTSELRKGVALPSKDFKMTWRQWVWRRICSEGQPTRAYRSQWWTVYGALVTKQMHIFFCIKFAE
jgi:hypothetical protein